ncbi:MAG TPA: DUF2817 domain-containing protein [Marmoricola sp.]|nr:DUF2817 domain-containing protein [Marmoricola sp.]
MTRLLKAPDIVARPPLRLLIAFATALLMTLSLWLTPAASPVAPTRVGAVNEVKEIGRTNLDLPILAFRVGDPQASVKAVVMSAIHGDERGPIRITNNLIHGAPIRGVDLWVIPVVNPDGLRARTRRNGRGVDLNRNFPTDWGRSYGQTYSGPSPASEPETQALMAFLDEFNPQYLISFHQPLRGVGVADQKPPGFQKALAKGLKLRLRSFNCTGVCHGTMTTWFNRNHAGIAITVEYGRRLSRRQATRTGPNGVLRALNAWR